MLPRLLILLALLCPARAMQAQWSDDFSDSTFTQNLVWTGDTSKFIVNTSGWLQLNAPAATDTALLATPSIVCYNASWQFNLKMDFNPSSGNYAKVFLTSSTNQLKGELDGYFLRIGYTNDDLCLYRKQGSTETLIADGRDKMFNTTVVNATIRVTRSERSLWTLYCDTTGGSQLSQVVQATDSTITSSAWFGLSCIYTSTRSTKFSFDNFVVTGDTFPEIVVPDTIVPPDTTTIPIDTVIVPVDTADHSRLFDVVFNEIMADPSPVAGLPEAEYIEIYNRSDSVFRLKDWKLVVGGTISKFPDIQLASKEYLILCARSDTSALQPFGRVYGLYSSSTSLNNTGQSLKLLNSEGRLIDWLNYSDTWYGDDFKMQGGYSLEQIDPSNPCGGQSNWIASRARNGGTPGAVNSVNTSNPDQSFPEVNTIHVLADTLVDIRFSEPVDTLLALQSTKYMVSPSVGSPNRVWINNKDYTSVRMLLSTPLLAGTSYTLTVSDSICDCVGQKMILIQTFPLSLPETPLAADLVFNEVRFNAPSNSAEYVEVFNPSSKFFNARFVLLGDVESGITKNLCRLSDEGFLIAPGNYLLFSKTPELIAAERNIEQPHNFFPIPSMLSLDDKAAHLVLLNDTFGTIDDFSYSESMQTSTLNSFDGVSLERVNPLKATSLGENWHSASEESGYGTPGYKNSQYLSDSALGSEFKVENELFSPDNDGYHDVLQITYAFEKLGIRGQASVYDLSGMLIKSLFTNRLLGTSGDFYWDGTDAGSKRCSVGPYLIFIRTVADDGTVREYRKSCVLAIKR